MESNLNHEDWVSILNQEYPIEFGWLGVDSSNHVEILISLNYNFL